MHVSEDNISNIEADIDGPRKCHRFDAVCRDMAVESCDVAVEGTPFEGGVFRIKLVLSGDFPLAPPKGQFAAF